MILPNMGRNRLLSGVASRVISLTDASVTSNATFDAATQTASSGTTGTQYRRAPVYTSVPFYFEVFVQWGGTAANYVGFSAVTAALASIPGQAAQSVRYQYNGIISNAAWVYGPTTGTNQYVSGDTIGFAVDPVNGRLYVHTNGVWKMGCDPVAGTGYFSIPKGLAWAPHLYHASGAGIAAITRFRFQPGELLYSPPAGFKAIDAGGTIVAPPSAGVTWDAATKPSIITLSNGNLTAAKNASGTGGVKSTVGYNDANEHICTLHLDLADQQEWFEVGVCSSAASLTEHLFPPNALVIDLMDNAIYGATGGGVYNASSTPLGTGSTVRLRLVGSNLYMKFNSDPEIGPLGIPWTGPSFVCVGPNDFDQGQVTADFSLW